jgi:hypothetical protein
MNDDDTGEERARPREERGRDWATGLLGQRPWEASGRVGGGAPAGVERGPGEDRGRGGGDEGRRGIRWRRRAARSPVARLANKDGGATCQKLGSEI